MLYERKFWDEHGATIEHANERLKLSRARTKFKAPKEVKKKESRILKLSCGHSVKEDELVFSLKKDFHLELGTTHAERVIFKSKNFDYF